MCAIDQDSCEWLEATKRTLWDEQCRQCPARQVRIEHLEVDWLEVEHVLELDLLRRGGFPMERLALSADEYFALGVVAEEKERLAWPIASKSSSPPATRPAAGSEGLSGD